MEDEICMSTQDYYTAISNKQEFSTQEIIDYLKNRIEQLLKLRKILYDMIDTTHYSPNNIVFFNQINELTIRIDEIHHLVSTLDR